MLQLYFVICSFFSFFQPSLALRAGLSAAVAAAVKSKINKQINKLDYIAFHASYCSLRTSRGKLKPTIHEATFVAGDKATLLFVRAAHEISNDKLLERMYHAIFPCAARTNNNVAVSPATKVASCMVGFRYQKTPSRHQHECALICCNMDCCMQVYA